MNHYETLGIDPSAEPNEIRKAFRRAAQRAHPDREGGSDEAMKAVNLAFEVLIDPAKRARYDRTGSDSDEPKGPDIDSMAAIAAKSFLGRYAAESKNPVADARKDIISEKERIAGVVRKATRDRDILEKRRKRVRGIEGNPLHQVIDGLMASASGTITEGEMNIKVLEKAMALISPIEFEPEPEPGLTASEKNAMDQQALGMLRDFMNRDNRYGFFGSGRY